jgi:hypothetical protein
VSTAWPPRGREPTEEIGPTFAVRIDDHDVRLARFNLSENSGSGPRVADELEIGLRCERRPQSLSDEPLIGDDEDLRTLLFADDPRIRKVTHHENTSAPAMDQLPTSVDLATPVTMLKRYAHMSQTSRANRFMRNAWARLTGLQFFARPAIMKLRCTDG